MISVVHLTRMIVEQGVIDDVSFVVAAFYLKSRVFVALNVCHVVT